MTTAQIVSFVLSLISQRLKQQEEEQEKEYNRLRLTQAKAGILAERSIERKKKEIERDQADENRRLSAEQQSK